MRAPATGECRVFSQREDGEVDGTGHNGRHAHEDYAGYSECLTATGYPRVERHCQCDHGRRYADDQDLHQREPRLRYLVIRRWQHRETDRQDAHVGEGKGGDDGARSNAKPPRTGCERVDHSVTAGWDPPREPGE